MQTHHAENVKDDLNHNSPPVTVNSVQTKTLEAAFTQLSNQTNKKQ